VKLQRLDISESITLFHGDALKIAPLFSHVAAIITDPPYGIAHQKGKGGQGKHRRRNTRAIRGDDRPFDPSPWLHYPQVTLWGADHFGARLPHGRFLAWDKLDSLEPWDSFCDVEFAWHNQRRAARIFRHRWKGIIKASENGKPRIHPTQKPVALMEWCIREARLAPGSLILDPYMGSGSTIIAAHRLGMRAVGIELDAQHFKAAARRIMEAAQ
jgi:site-specific DNA-methyltransferase (adenine-specific)/modification methylase